MDYQKWAVFGFVLFLLLCSFSNVIKSEERASKVLYYFASLFVVGGEALSLIWIYHQ